MNEKHEQLRAAAAAFTGLVPNPEEFQGRLIDLGVLRTAYRDGTTGLPMAMVGQIFGAMVSGGATVEQAKRWIIEGEEPSPEALRMSVSAVEQIERLRAVALEEFRAVCRSGSHAAPFAFLIDQLGAMYADILVAMDNETTT